MNIIEHHEIEKYFTDLTQFQALDFQKSLCKNLLECNNVLLQAPTGAGKTWAAILPFIIAKAENLHFPQKLIYSLPMRTLANSLYDSVRENELIKKLGVNVTLQTGEQPNDPYLLDGEIIFTTIDQSLSALLSIPLSLTKRQANMNAGALIGSYLVFDEFHLLDPQKSFSTLLHLLKMLNGYSPFCLMTATLSERLLNELSKEIDAKVISINQEELTRIPSQRNKKRLLSVSKESLTTEDVIKHHTVGSKTIVLANTVDKCQEIYGNLIKMKDNGTEKLRNTDLVCIHSRFFGRDRLEKEFKVKKLFEKGSTLDAILVSTQVVEVGIDITCDVMHTECSPINSFLQRIGRCARYENEQGNIFVYAVNKTLPYDAQLTKDTFELLNDYNGQNVDNILSQKLINKLLTDKELRELYGIVAGQRDEEIKKAWMTCEKSNAHNLIREVDSVFAILLPITDNIENPYHFETISISRHSLLHKLKKIDATDWLVKVVRESIFIDELDVDNEHMTRKDYSCDTIAIEDVKYEPLIILNSNYIRYDEEIGLNFVVGEKCSGIISNETLANKSISITKDTYEEHIEYMMQAYDKYFRGKNEYILKEFSKRLAISFPLNDLIGFMIVLHDYGKLNVAWQEKAYEYQNKKDKIGNDVLLAHTDYSEQDERIKFPPHAGAGAVVSIALLENVLQDKGSNEKLLLILCRTLATTILRHHSALSVKTVSYVTVKKAIETISVLLNKYSKSMNVFNKDSELLRRYGNDDLSNYLIPFSSNDQDVNETLLYFYFVRILRICDQKSFEIKTHIRGN